MIDIVEEGPYSIDGKLRERTIVSNWHDSTDAILLELQRPVYSFSKVCHFWCTVHSEVIYRKEFEEYGIGVLYIYFRKTY